ncbi:MAG TPA: 4-hydroxyphenylpyruvate dioxygenase [Polyangiaceae bacterium]|jgi:4-hydroxyphenylpyruvate dioxygenase|nr:4-hydroxyphenylpyruvate dioxygenase [Polyangiaceae bacterium]
MAELEALGILGLEGVHYYVRDLERSERFYIDRMDFAEIAASGATLNEGGHQRSRVFRAGEYVVMCSTPLGDGGRADRYLKKHPDGIGTLAFRVRDAERAFTLLDGRGATPISEVQTFKDDGGTLKTFSITTPFGDTTFRFVERRGYRGFFPGFEQLEPPAGGQNRCRIRAVDHITSNFQTMSPALLWMEHVLGFERYWDVEFHTRDVGQVTMRDGSGLRSVVMWDKHSGLKFANNEPYRPNFKASQINIFNEDHRGDGVQHIALEVEDIIRTVRDLRARGVEFMPTPNTYYDALPERLHDLEIDSIDEEVSVLRELQLLVDGHGHKSYLLQIFLKDSAGLYGSREAGPFFYELIQRKGDSGFGAGNFRALFESIERQQMIERELSAEGNH